MVDKLGVIMGCGNLSSANNLPLRIGYDCHYGCLTGAETSGGNIEVDCGFVKGWLSWKSKRMRPEQVEDEAKPMETETNGVEPTSKSDGFEEKTDTNDVPAEESQAPENDPLGRQDLNESTLDLSLGLKAHDGETDSDSKIDQNKDG